MISSQISIVADLQISGAQSSIERTSTHLARKLTAPWVRERQAGVNRLVQLLYVSGRKMILCQ